MKLTGKKALELQLEAWYLVLEEGMDKAGATGRIAQEHGLRPHTCLLCVYACSIDPFNQGYVCDGCPLVIVSGCSCHSGTSPYYDWRDNRSQENVEMVISYLLGIQAEWERRYG